MLTIFGSINIDQVIRVASIPAPGETVLGERVTDAHGGKGANQAVAAARAGAGDVPVTMVGAVGDDAHGDAALKNFAANGVLCELVRSAHSATGTAFIKLSDDGENAITVISWCQRPSVSHPIVCGDHGAHVDVVVPGRGDFRRDRPCHGRPPGSAGRRNNFA